MADTTLEIKLTGDKSQAPEAKQGAGSAQPYKPGKPDSTYGFAKDDWNRGGTYGFAKDWGSPNAHTPGVNYRPPEKEKKKDDAPPGVNYQVNQGSPDGKGKGSVIRKLGFGKPTGAGAEAGGAKGVGGAASAAIKAIELIIQAATKLINFATQQTLLATQRDAAQIKGNQLEADIAQKKKGYAYTNALPLVGGLSESIQNYRIAELQQPYAISDAFRKRTQDLARYNVGIASTVATGDVNKQLRNINEAGIAGGRYAEVEQQRQQLEAIEQQLSTAQALQKVPGLLSDLKDQQNKRSAQLEAELKKLPKNIADEIRKGNKAKSPLQELREQGGIKQIDDFQSVRDQQDRFRQNGVDSALNVPLLRGF